MTKKLDLNQSVYKLTQTYPELIEMMAGLGFTEITKKAMLHSVGKIMTIPKGARMKNISMTKIVAALRDHGFEIVGPMPEASFLAKPEREKASTGESSEPSPSRTEQIKSYLKRLGEGETLESVRADFVRAFGEVEASEIMQAEQELLNEGTPLAEVQQLCDVHSALFHGATREEKIANTEKEVAASVLRQKMQAVKEEERPGQAAAGTDKDTRTAALALIPGHPLCTFTKENEALAELLAQFKETRDESLLPSIRALSIHYAKKGDLLYPLLKVKYGVTGPSEVMWTVDDEIRNALGTLAEEKTHDEDWNARLDAVLTRAEEMIYKEENILFPVCTANFKKEDWYSIYHDAKDYDVCLGAEHESWDEAESAADVQPAALQGEIVMPGGHLTLEQLTVLLNTLPVEISFVDADNMNRYFNEGPKVFKRPRMAIDREVFSCHPPKIEPMVRQIIDDFRNNRSDVVPVWMEKGGRTMFVQYMAVRDRAGNYLGTLEVVQDMESAKAHFRESLS